MTGPAGRFIRISQLRQSTVASLTAVIDAATIRGASAGRAASKAQYGRMRPGVRNGLLEPPGRSRLCLPSPNLLQRYLPFGQAPTRPAGRPVDNLCTSGICLCTVCGQGCG
jgi:hypothetical protein